MPADVETLMTVDPGNPSSDQKVADYLQSYFGYKHDFVGYVALILIGAPALFVPENNFICAARLE